MWVNLLLDQIKRNLILHLSRFQKVVLQLFLCLDHGVKLCKEQSDILIVTGNVVDGGPVPLFDLLCMVDQAVNRGGNRFGQFA